MIKPFANKTSLIAALTLLLLSSGCAKTSAVKRDGSPLYDKLIMLGDQKLYVQVASDTASQTEGLSDRVSMKNDEGMLFDFREQGIQNEGFWMKDMKFDLD